LFGDIDASTGRDSVLRIRMGTTDDLHVWDGGCIICIFGCGLCPLHRQIFDIDVVGVIIIIIVTVLGLGSAQPSGLSLSSRMWQKYPRHHAEYRNAH
jgi:hypothetical protein